MMVWVGETFVLYFDDTFFIYVFFEFGIINIVIIIITSTVQHTVYEKHRRLPLVSF
jgi:hypothetical protein